MTEIQQYIQLLFTQKEIVIAPNRKKIFEEYLNDVANINAVIQIQENQKMMTDKWKIISRIRDIIEKQLVIPNATVGKQYEALLDFDKAGLNDLIYTEFEGLNEYGLAYNNQTETLTGNPTKGGDIKVLMKFRVSGESDNSELNSKEVNLVINADPKSLWKTIPSDENKDIEWKEKNYWKPDNIDDFQPIGDKHILVSSKRGRSHANVGSFRDDHYAFKDYSNTGWSIVCVADGAGSAKLSRHGSKIACDGIVDFFEVAINEGGFADIDEIIKKYHCGINEGSEIAEIKIQNEIPVIEPVLITEEVETIDEPMEQVNCIQNGEPASPFQDAQKELNLFLYNNLGKAAFSVHKKLAEFAIQKEVQLKDFHSTLIFALFKKYEFGYAIFTFGVGDCPIGLLNKDLSQVKLMNWLDVGEFGGGTRFITMPEIFNSENFSTRFGFKLIDDFSYLILMTDGIYDPKFVVEANLEKIEKWKEFVADLEGNNEEKIKVELKPDNKDIANQLSAWMDFWSPGNHDDRTLAIVF